MLGQRRLIRVYKESFLNCIVKRTATWSISKLEFNHFYLILSCCQRSTMLLKAWMHETKRNLSANKENYHDNGTLYSMVPSFILSPLFPVFVITILNWFHYVHYWQGHDSLSNVISQWTILDNVEKDLNGIGIRPFPNHKLNQHDEYG